MAVDSFSGGYGRGRIKRDSHKLDSWCCRHVTGRGRADDWTGQVFGGWKRESLNRRIAQVSHVHETASRQCWARDTCCAFQVGEKSSTPPPFMWETIA